MEDLSGKTFGQYKIIAPLGEGGMAAVYKAFQASTERFVALKVLPRHFAKDPQFVTRFKQEAKLLAHLQHPHILSVFDFGQEEEFPFIVMPYVHGGTLKDLLSGVPLPWPQIRKVITQVGEGLYYAHTQGLIHRDVKPSNILLDESGNCLLGDFGLAKIMEASVHITNSGATLGTPAYLSPEQGLGERIDARTDIYSLGVVLYEMATGRTPFRADTPVAIIYKHIHDTLPPAKTFNPEIPLDLEQVINISLEKSPDKRYSNALKMVQAVQRAIPDLPISVHPGFVREAPQPPLSPEPGQESESMRQIPQATQTTQTPIPHQKTRRYSLLFAGVSLLIVVLLSAMLLFGKGLFDNFQTTAIQNFTAPSSQDVKEGNSTPTKTAMTQTPLLSPEVILATETPIPTLTSGLTPTFTNSPTVLPDILPITSGVGNNYQPSFSPDGSRIVFISTRDGNQEIYLMNMDGTEQTRLTNTPDLSEDLPSFSLDGSLIVYSVATGNNEDIYVRNLDGSLVKNLTNTPNSNEGRPKFFSGQFVSLNILFDSDRSGNWEIYTAPFVANQLGTITQVTHRPDFTDRFPNFISSTSQIVFRAEAKGTSDSRLYLINSDSTNLIALSQDSKDWYPMPSSDGQWILFVSDRDGNEELYAMQLDGANILRLTENPARDTTPAISPDNQWIVFASNRGGNNLHLYRMYFVLSKP